MQAYKPANITVEQLMQIVDDLKENFSKLQIGLALDFKFAHRDALLSIEDAFKVPVRLSEVDHLNPDRLLSLEEIENHYFLYDFDADPIKRYFSSLALDILAEIIATRNSMMIKVLKSESGIKLSEVEANFKIANNQSTLTMRTLIGFCSNNKIDTKPLIAICKKYNQPIPKIQLNVALDYDGCANADVPAFLSIVATMQNFGHKVYIVTMRYPSECRSILEEFGTFVDGIIPTSRHSKREACESLGIKIHIWMDDTPLAVEKSAGDIWGAVTPEGCIHSIDHTSGETGETKVEPLTNFSMLMIPVFDPTNVSLVIRG